MSAYVCSIDHFKALALFATKRGIGGEYKVDWGDLASAYADLLYQENIRSVRARYPNDTWESVPGPCEKPLHLIFRPGETALAKNNGHSPVQILKLCDCLEYQSCETEDYRDTAAYELLDAIRRAAIQDMRRLWIR